MTAGDYIPPGDGTLEQPNVPVVFGVRMTPPVIGVLAALAGFGLAAFLLTQLVQPAWQENQALQQEADNKRSQLVDRAEIERRLNEAQANLQREQQLNADVRTLFANQESLDTLLLDINARVQAVNAGIQDPDRRATLSQFDLNTEESGVITDGSLGPEMNNRINARIYDVEMKGSYAQTESIIRNIERLQPLLVVRNFNSQLDEATQAIRLNSQGRLTPTGQPETRITTAFQLIGLVPTDPTPAAAPAPADGTAAPAP
ncbi:MAG: hypothetical protein HC895_02730 [Leptolyngbyaceae cyanobacterium SM1_3_5]|nr:hypothetical protein [Leptolyngbyaceae cyanobacterium SM1_3_5]